jgi:preprotein translocase subunit SecD
MDTFFWTRMGPILLLMLGSFWVLLPTVVQNDVEASLAAEAAQVETPGGGHTAVNLDVVLAVDQGDPEALSTLVESRLSAAAVPHARVEVKDGAVVAKLSVGASPEKVRILATRPGVVALYLPSSVAVPAAPGEPDLAGLPPGLADALKAAGADLAVWAHHLPELGGQAVPAGAVAIPVKVTGAMPGATPTVALSGPLPEPFAIVAIDGQVSGVVVGATSFFPLSDPDALAVLASGPLPGKLSPAAGTSAEAPAAQEEAAAPAAPSLASKLPDWFLNLLPNTRMALGLDLQGGIDLTLQVELEDAVQSQVARDAGWLKEKASKVEEGGIKIDNVRNELSDPILWVTSSAPVGDVQTFVRKNQPDYEYVSSQGESHSFKMKDTRVTDVQKSAVDQVLETLRKRVDATGVKEPSIVKKGGGRINIQLPGKVDLQQAIDALGTTAVLEFRLVDEEFDPRVLDQDIQAAKDALPADQFADDKLVDEWLWQTKRIDEDHIVMWEYTPGDKPERTQALALKRPVVLTGSDINDAGVNWDQNQQPYVSLDFKPHGGQVFCQITTANVGKRFAIILDDKVSSSPVIRDKICGGSAKIDMNTGEDPLKDAQTLALVLRTGSLDAPVVVGEVRNVGAQLGRDSVRDGLVASVFGSIFVITFMLLWYKRSGIVADIALIANVLMMLAGLALFGATLTLPGICGIALTVGMEVDGNIIIYERIREELKHGMNQRKAVELGFEHATVTILDSHITSAISGIVLYSYGTGPIRGFAVTLLIGIATTLVSVLFISRSLMELMSRNSTSRLSI